MRAYSDILEAEISSQILRVLTLNKKS